MTQGAPRAMLNVESQQETALATKVAESRTAPAPAERRRAVATCLHHTAALVTLPSAWMGAARILDLGGTLDQHLYAYSQTPEEADSWAIWRDWAALGEDMRQVFTLNGMQVELHKKP